MSLRTFGSHRIRHATATLLVNNGMPLEEASRYLGHSSTMPTRRYAQQPKREVIRCLKRYVAREIYLALKGMSSDRVTTNLAHEVA